MTCKRWVSNVVREPLMVLSSPLPFFILRIHGLQFLASSPSPRISTWGHPDINHISTSYVERQNLSIRTQVRRLTRLTNAFSKKVENLRAAMDLHFCHYNFVRFHRSIRCTPAMEIGITSSPMTVKDLVEMAA